MPTVVCIINQKGGCGKSSTCFHLSGAMSAHGKRVLLLDLDPQGSLTQGFLGSMATEAFPRHATSALLFDETLCESPLSRLVRTTEFAGVSLVAANQHLAQFNAPLTEAGSLLLHKLRSDLRSLPGYDFVLIDCPPNLYRCSLTAMIAADGVLVPVPPEDFGTQGLRAVCQSVNAARRANPALCLLGYVVTRQDRRLIIHRTYENRLRRVYGDGIFHTAIPEATAFKMSLASRTPVEFDQPQSAAARAMRELSRELEERSVKRRHYAGLREGL
ncbi:MAG: ParA family protein [Planctomycetaceae bacterium]